jgi:hypothetical protein
VIVGSDQQRTGGSGEHDAAVFRPIVAGPVTGAYADDRSIEELRARFAEHGYVKLPRLLSDAALAVVRQEVTALEPQARARDFVMSGPDTPRVMSVLGASQLLAGAPATATLYVHFELVRVIARIAGTPVHRCTHPEELMVCNFLLAQGSTHGWHLDDPPYALIVVLEAPAPGAGGELEYIPGWADLNHGLGIDPGGPVDAGVAAARADGLIRKADHRSGDAYLLRADRVAHRVAPLQAPGTRRIALNFAYEASAVASYGDSATVLYGPEDPSANA